MLGTLHPTSGFASEASLGSLPHTPPRTPARPIKRPLERSDSPVSNAGSIHPADTVSPAKKPAKRIAVEDNIKIEELGEDDVGYQTDMDVVYPEELEEVSSPNDSDDSQESTASDVSDSETTGLTRRLSRLRCGDDREVDFEELRRRIHQEKRNSHLNNNIITKRSHSQSIRNEVEATDTDALDDHDLTRSQRRLRRRVRGPREAGIAFEVLLRSSPEVGGIATPEVQDSSAEEDVDVEEDEDMDVDESD